MLRNIVLLTLVLSRVAAAQFTNQAKFYSGNFDWTTSLGMTGTPSDGSAGKTVENVAVAIVAGKATCKGTFHDSEDTYQAGKLISRATTVGTIAGPGYALIEFGVGTDTLPGQPIYTITVSCPTWSGTVTSISFVPGGSGSVDTVKAQPAEQGHHEWSTYSVLDTGKGLVLKGSTNYAHPDNDPANNVAATVVLTWSLIRLP